MSKPPMYQLILENIKKFKGRANSTSEYHHLADLLRVLEKGEIPEGGKAEVTSTLRRLERNHRSEKQLLRKTIDAIG